MLETADACRREIQLAGFFLGEGDELFDGADGNAGMDGEDVRAGSELGDRVEGFDRIVREFVERGIDRVGGRDDEQGVPIGLRFRRGFSAEDTTRPAAIVRDDLLAEPFGQFGGDEAPYDVVAAARRKRNDEAHGLRRIGLCRCHPERQRNRANGYHRGQSFHFVFHFTFLLTPVQFDQSTWPGLSVVEHQASFFSALVCLCSRFQVRSSKC
jgi:hypothetical protein